MSHSIPSTVALCCVVSLSVCIESTSVQAEGPAPPLATVQQIPTPPSVPAPVALTPWLEQLRATTAAREARDVVVAFVSERDTVRTTDKARTVLRNQTVRARVFAPGTMGYTFIPPRQQPVVVFVNKERVEAPLVDLIAAHELGHVLLHARGFLQVVMFPDDPREPVITDAFNAVQDVLLERELAALGVDTKPLLVRQARTISRALALSGPSGIVPDSGALQTSHLATMVTPLVMTLPADDPALQRLQHVLPGSVARLVRKYVKILSRPVTTPAVYREVMYQACEANGLSRSQVAFAPD